MVTHKKTPYFVSSLSPSIYTCQKLVKSMHVIGVCGKKNSLNGDCYRTAEFNPSATWHW